MIKLHQFPKNKMTWNFSPYCLKLETYLRMTGQPFETVTTFDPRKAPKGKLPYIEDEGTAIPDSSLVIEYLKKKYGDKLDASLSTGEKAQIHAVKRMMETGLILPILYFRWVDDAGWNAVKPVFFGTLPFPLRLFVPELVRGKMRKYLTTQGLARHSREAISDVGRSDLDSLSAVLGSKPFFMGAAPTSLDATAYGFLNNVVHDLIESPLKTHAASLPNLKAYCDRMQAKFFS